MPGALRARGEGQDAAGPQLRRRARAGGRCTSGCASRSVPRCSSRPRSPSSAGPAARSSRSTRRAWSPGAARRRTAHARRGPAREPSRTGPRACAGRRSGVGALAVVAGLLLAVPLLARALRHASIVARGETAHRRGGWMIGMQGSGNRGRPVSTLSNLLAAHTDLSGGVGGPPAAHRRRVAAARRPVVRGLPAVGARDEPEGTRRFLCMAQSRPTTTATAHPEDMVGSAPAESLVPQLRAGHGGHHAAPRGPAAVAPRAVGAPRGGAGARAAGAARPPAGVR